VIVDVVYQSLFLLISLISCYSLTSRQA